MLIAVFDPNGRAIATSYHHPVVITPTEDASLNCLSAYLAASGEQIQQLLLKQGAILFRGFGLNGAQDFRSCSKKLGATSFDYIGGNPSCSMLEPSTSDIQCAPRSLENHSLHPWNRRHHSRRPRGG
ncbi:MAG: TauD/TfdA family dioxygenase [Pseudomonadota bacterium]|nr:TauD/TfdA family dioxygenase [Pseudomonadota bacterium]